MSVDLEATVARPVALGAVLGEARRILSVLLNVAAVPDLVVFVDREYRQGVRVGRGRRVDEAELRVLMIGEPPPTSPVHVEIDVPGTGDGVWLTVLDLEGDAGPERHAVFSPCRTCVGVATATGLALATARLTGGRYVDEQIGMVTGPDPEPDHVIRDTRLSGGGDFAVQCERYLRQFPHLSEWPRDRSVRA